MRTLAAAAAATAVLGLGAAAAEAAGPFKGRSARIATAKLFDLGVAEIDGDGYLDIFTTNHKFLSTFKLGNGTGFGRNLNGRGLEQTRGLPFVENLFNKPRKDLPGVYAWVDPVGALHLASRGLGKLGLPELRVTGTVKFYGPFVELQTRKQSEATEHRLGDAGGSPRTDVDFELGAFGHIVLEPPHVDLPLTVTVDAPFPVDRIYVGPRRIRPPARTFTITLRDRHGIAWADLGGDSGIDAYVARGGLGGKINRYEGVIEDELLVQGADGSFTDETHQLGVVKGTCRSRQANAIDYNRDGRLDLYSNCKNANPQLYRQKPAGGFFDDSASLAGTAARGTAYTWLDLDGDVRPELIAGRRHSLGVYKRDELGDWDRVERVHARNDADQVAKILPANIDDNRSTDLFVAARSGNTIALNRRGSLETFNPARWGLPGHGSVAAAWVDFDNDGLTDLHLVPQGIFRRKPNGHFERTGYVRGHPNSLWAIDHWADFDNDGDRDVLLAEKGPNRRVRVRRLENTFPGGHWLELDLTGSAFNRQAIGARVVVKAGGKRQIRRVGEAEGSRFSQGHYRLYFGLGRRETAERVIVIWPNNSRTKLSDVAADQRLEIGIDD